MPNKDPEVLPAIDNTKFEDKTFTPITVNDDDRTTTIQDLEILNTYLECNIQALPKARSIGGLVVLSKNAMELIACRRAVKKLPFGTNKGSTSKGRTIEVLD